ncbi:MAG: hypothetical protein HKP61_13880 [Dactylosporangium sp.]|nr:hypothetical protein [Dactylosporangium sp.]NNJ62003.1 hypothetical protein [Dactylosporangium sp.]
MDFVIGLDIGHRNVPSAERWIHSVLAPLIRSASVVVCTHAVSRPFPHLAISLVGRGGIDGTIGNPPPFRAVPDDPSLAAVAAQAADDHAHRRSGRAVVYPGIERLTGALRVEEVLALSAIERVVVLDGSPPGSAEPPPDAKLDTREYVRPQWSCGRLTLPVRPTVAGDLVPFEGPYPTAVNWMPP